MLKLFKVADDYMYDNTFTSLFAVYITLFIGMGIAALNIYAIFGNLTRFRKNLFSDQGYLMHTLPVTVHENILCKLIVGVIYYIATRLITSLCTYILSGESTWWFSLSYLFGAYSSEKGADYYINIILGYCSSVAIYCAFVLMGYLCISIGSMTNGKRSKEFLIAIPLLFCNSMVHSLIQSITGFSVYSNQTYILNIIYYLLISVGLYFITHEIIKNHLNLP
jgi:hypothetical protein